MARRKRKSDPLREHIALILRDCGLSKVASYVEITGVEYDTYVRPHQCGEVVFNYGCAHSNSKALFVSAQVGLNSPWLSKVFDSLVPNLSKSLSVKYALMGWGIGDAGATEFEPCPERPGSHFVVSEPLQESQLAYLRSKIPIWLKDAESYFNDRPLYDFYRSEWRIDKSGRWREIVAILKILGGERYIGHQLLYDLAMEAKGLRSPMGSEWWEKTYGLRRDDSEVAFQEGMLTAVRQADGNGMYGKECSFAVFRQELALSTGAKV